ncbi:MAG: hypothetical protein AAFV29_06955 [Myxococcota bacterium]
MVGPVKQLFDYPESDLKLAYLVLQGQLQQHPELIDNQILEDLQTHLQKRARADGIDPTYHPAWAAWLRGQPPPSPPAGPSLKLVE